MAAYRINRGDSKDMRAFVLTVGLAATVLASVYAIQTDVAGAWEITLNTQVGETKWTATFEQDGTTLSGEVDIGDRENFLLEGTINGNMLEFVFVVPDLDGDQPINLSGTVNGDTIEGDEGSFIWYGTGVWTGTKQSS